MISLVVLDLIIFWMVLLWFPSRLATARAITRCTIACTLACSAGSKVDIKQTTLHDSTTNSSGIGINCGQTSDHGNSGDSDNGRELHGDVKLI
ncbi:hypothetical protein BDF22DRAFT_670488, partial [Syncephalis plumigaleata]